MALRGWVYVVTNRAMPSLVKVGFSMKDPKLRAAEFDNAGLPYPYVVVYEAVVESPREVEQKAHRSLKHSLENREWFRCEPHVAIAALRAAAGQTMFERAEAGVESPSAPPAAEAVPPKPRYRDSSRFDRARAALRAEWERRGVTPPQRK